MLFCAVAGFGGLSQKVEVPIGIISADIPVVFLNEE